LIQKTLLAPATKLPFDPWVDPWRNIPLAVQTVSWHLRKVFWPWPQVADLRGLFPAQLGQDHGWGSFWNGGGVVATGLGLALLVLLLLAAWRTRKRRGPLVLGGVAFFLLALVPVANFIPLNEPAAEHYLYLPLMGLAVSVAAMAAPLCVSSLESHQTGWRRGGRLLSWILLAGLAISAGARSMTWRSADRLWSSVLRVNGGSERAHNNHGLALLAAGDRTGARHAFQTALRLPPTPSPRAGANLITIARQDGDLSGALGTADMVLSAHPDDPLILSLQGGILLEMGKVAEASRVLEEVAELPRGPDRAAPGWARDRGVARYLGGDAAGALVLLEEALRQDPADGSLLVNIGAVLLELGRPEEAETVLRRAVDLPGASGMAHRNLAVALLELGRPAEASRQLEEAEALGCHVPPSLAEAVEQARVRSPEP
jgi:Flp pilus assembly protein TadD